MSGYLRTHGCACLGCVDVAGFVRNRPFHCTCVAGFVRNRPLLKRLTNSSGFLRNQLQAYCGGLAWFAFVGVICQLIITHSPDLRVQAAEPTLNRPSAVVVDPTGSKIFIANAAQANIAVVARNNFDLQTEPHPVPAGIVAMVGFGDGSKALTISDYPPSLAMVDFNRPTDRTTSLSLSSRPARLAISGDQKCAAVSMTWDRAIVLVQFNDSGLSVDSPVTRIELAFPPKELIAIDPTKFLIADAFGGSLAILDAVTGKIVTQQQIQGHHVGGLCYDEASQTALITHQRLSTIAETNYDDIHWGTLMQNLVSQVPIQSLLEPTGKINAQARLYRLGNPGKGAADPAGIVSWPDGRFAVAIAGSNEVGFGKLGDNDVQFVSVGAKPTKILKLGEDQLLCINELDDTISVIDKAGDPSVIKTIGEPKRGTSLAAQGELDFYSGRLSHDGWMSCSSCHVEGFTPDLVSDTFGDGGFGNAKRIPSLFGATATGPWGWNGRKKTLEDQIKATLSATMHRDAYQKQDISDDEIVKRLMSFIDTLDHPSPVRVEPAANEEDIRLGSKIFHSRACSKCHDPSSRFTSADVYDVGVTDEFGQSKFNPPSLSNLNVRRAFFHDGRFNSLDEVLKKHPQDEAVSSDLQRQQLKAFLLSL
jgi:Di-haem cytochrome c peroxidase